MSDEPEVVAEVPEAGNVVDDQATEASSEVQPIDAAEEARRSFQADYTRKMQAIAQEREQMKKEREEWEKTRGSQQADTEPDFDKLLEGIDGDPLGGSVKALATQHKLTTAMLKKEREENAMLRQRVDMVADMVLEGQFEKQYDAAINSYAAGIELDKAAVQQYIIDNGLAASPRTMVKDAIKAIAADQYIAKATQSEPVAPVKKQSALPRSAGTAPGKVAMTPREELAEAGKALARKLGFT